MAPYTYVNNLSDPVLMILQAIISCKSEFAKEIYQRYSTISSRYKEKPFSYVYYYANLSCLQSMGLVALISTKVIFSSALPYQWV